MFLLFLLLVKIDYQLAFVAIFDFIEEMTLHRD